jgi:DNA polymerase-3 subunit gamma/tau
MLGSVDRSYVFRLIEALALGDGKAVVEISETLRLNGLSAASTLEEMSTVLQRMAVVQTVGAAADDDSDAEAGETARLAGLMPRDETQLLYSMCLHGRGDLGLAPDEYAALTMVLLRLLAFKPPSSTSPAEKKTLNSPAPAPAKADPVPSAAVSATPAAVMAAVVAPDASATSTPARQAARTMAVQPWEDDPVVPPGHAVPVRDTARPPNAVDRDDPVDPDRDFESNTTVAPVNVTRVATKVVAVPVRQQPENRVDAANPPASPALLPTEEGDFWHATVQQLIQSEAITAMVRELALQSQLVARDTDQWIVRVERESLNQSGSRDRLSAALQNAGYDVQLVVEIGRVTDCPARRNSAASEEKQLAAQKIIYDDPFVQSMMRDFGAKIVPGSIKPL